MSTALIPYTPPKTPMEFIQSEVERGLSNGSISIEQTIPHPISAPHPCWKGRTEEINSRISYAFNRIVSDTASIWGKFNGSDTYQIGGIKEHKLMRKIIQEAPPECKHFYALDIGAGNYQWGRALAKYLNAKKDIPQDVTIHIIGIRGETNLDKPATKLGQCILYQYGAFQIETLEDELQKRGLQLANKVDLVVSRWCLRHLVDPLGTFTQAYDLLRPKTGHLLLDGFIFLYENEQMSRSLNFNSRMIRLCLETRAPFVTFDPTDPPSLNHFVVNKPNAHPCHVQKQYLGSESVDQKFYQIGSETVTRFKAPQENEGPTLLLNAGDYDYRGDKGLYERLRQNGLLYDTNLVWGPLQDGDVHKKIPPLHIAIATKDEEAIERCLQEGCDINESDYMGFTPLHLAIQHNNYTLFSWLLDQGAQTKLFASGCTPLHLAMQYDRDGCFIEALIVAGANVNIKPNAASSGRSWLTPLELAIKNKNVRAVELLLNAKAVVTYKNRQSLDSEPIFSSIQHLFPKKSSELQGFDIILDYINRGNHVFLTYPGKHWGYEFKPSTLLEEGSQLIRVMVNPETRLLDDGNHQEIEDMSPCRQESYFTFIDNMPDFELTFGY